MMASSTPCSASAVLRRAWRCACRSLVQVFTCSLLLIGTSFGAAAEPLAVDVSQLKLERSEDGIYLSANIRFDLPPVVEDALLKGIAMHFLAEADVYRDRWDWYDKKVTTTARHMRVAFQPLTRRWRLNVSSGLEGNTGLGVTLNQNFDTLSEVMAAVQRISRWRIADAGEIDADARYNVDFRFRLDVSQLPRPFQIGAVGQSDWNVSVSRNVRLQMEPVK